MTKRILHIRHINYPNLTFCDLKIEIIQCRPRYGFCNLPSGHKLKHNTNTEILESIILLADDNDTDSDICSDCLVNSY